MKSKLIVNPVSGTDSGPDHLATVNALIRERVGPLDIVMTISEADAADSAERAVREGVDHLFVGGGDGTLNGALNGVARVDGGLEAVTFGLIPLGTGNDFATAMGLPEAIDAAVVQLFEGTPFQVDVGRLNDRYFVNVSAGGFIAEVSDAVNPQLKSIAGKLAYLLGGAQVALSYDPVFVEVRSAAVTVSEPLHTFAVCNSRLVGGGRLIAPRAVVDDGLLDVCLIRAMPALEFVALLRQVSAGDHIDDERVTYFQTAELEMAFDRSIKVNTDGEVLQTDRCRYSLLPGAARFLGRPRGTPSV